VERQDISKRGWLLAAIIFGIPLILLGLYSISSAQSRFGPFWHQQKLDKQQVDQDSLVKEAGAALSMYLETSSFRILTANDTFDLGITDGEVQAVQSALQPDHTGVERVVCVANTGLRETRSLTIHDQIEVERVDGAYQPVPELQFVTPVNHEVVPHERWCQTDRFEFTGAPELRYRLTTIVSITNYSNFLPGSSQCPFPQGCPVGVAASADLQVPLKETPTQATLPAVAPTLEPTRTPTVQPLVIGISSSPPEDPPASVSFPPPDELPPAQVPQDTPTPQSTQPPPLPDSGPTDEPTQPPDEDDDDEDGDDEDGHDDNDEDDDDDDEDDDDDGDDDEDNDD
jgi:hypothetical protein